MKTVVVTGGTRGIGYGLAQAFLARGCQVAICGRSPEAVEQAVKQLSNFGSVEKVLGLAGDVRYFAQVQALWDRTQEHYGRVDIWINNAGLSTEHLKTWEVSPESVRRVVETNMLGTIFGAQVAMRGMLAQGGGDLYIMEGMGSDGRRRDGMAFYGMTKYGLNYFFRSLVAETRHTTVRVGALRPGMVITDLITRPYQDRPQDWERHKKIFNLIADKVENVAPWLVEAILANQRHGAVLSYMPTARLLWRFLSAPFSKRDLFAGQSETGGS